MKNYLIIIALCLLSFFSLSSTAGQKTEDNLSLPPGIMVLSGDPAPKLVLKDIDGEAFDLVQHRGSWVFVHFWATWCGPCRREMPLIQKLSTRPEFGSFKMALVNTAEDEDKVFSFMGIVAPDLVTLMDYDGTVTGRWQPRGLPSTFLIDPEGRQRFLALGGRDWSSPEFLAFLKMISKAR